jgi:hypothetical protein
MSENSTSVTTSQPQKALQVPRTKQILKRAYHNASGHLAGFNQTNQTDVTHPTIIDFHSKIKETYKESPTSNPARHLAHGQRIMY